ncbi:unnamed protein product [Lactuca virosa]|uniref:Uncharacterized protein n=1 Tax=Lactuca virosa TaxID=75947 RepID=A0AAU9M2M7_9ASTR|nr:unnamed protein product [Lactuca virosa]
MMEADEKVDRCQIQLVENDNVFLTKHIFLESIGLPSSAIRSCYETPSTAHVFQKLLEIGHKVPLDITSNFKKSKLPFTWNFLVHIIIHCLTGKTRGTNQPSTTWRQIIWGIITGRPVDYTTCLWNDLKEYIVTRNMEIPLTHFWIVCLESLYNVPKILVDESMELVETCQIKRFVIPE